MSTRFETNKDLSRERKAIEYFVKKFNGTFKKLDPNDIDYKVFDKEGKLIAYAEIKGRYKTIANSYPLPVACRKIVKLCDKRLNPVIIWACDDGIVYGQPSQIEGNIRWGGRKPREGAVNDQELMIYYPKQKNTKVPYVPLNYSYMIDSIIKHHNEEEFLKADGFDDAIIGVDEKEMRLIYSVSKCLRILEKDMSPLDSFEYFTYNVSGAHMGDKTPIWCWDLYIS